MPAQNFSRDGQNHDAQIKPDGPVLDVRQVTRDPVFDLVQGFRFTAPSVHLSPAGDARFDAMAESIPGNNISKQLVLRLGVGRMGTRSNQRHVAFEDVQQLRQLVQT